MTPPVFSAWTYARAKSTVQRFAEPLRRVAPLMAAEFRVPLPILEQTEVFFPARRRQLAWVYDSNIFTSWR